MFNLEWIVKQSELNIYLVLAAKLRSNATLVGKMQKATDPNDNTFSDPKNLAAFNCERIALEVSIV